jgi:hypothetical protein
MDSFPVAIVQQSCQKANESFPKGNKSKQTMPAGMMM